MASVVELDVTDAPIYSLIFLFMFMLMYGCNSLSIQHNTLNELKEIRQSIETLEDD